MTDDDPIERSGPDLGPADQPDDQPDGRPDGRPNGRPNGRADAGPGATLAGESAGAPQVRRPSAFGLIAEATVVGRAQDGDVDAFEQLARYYQGPLFRLAFRLLGDRGEAEDVLQETLVQAWRRLPVLTHPEAFHSWIYQTITRRCMSLLRTRSRRRTAPTQDEDLEEALADRQVLGGHQPGADPADAAEYAAQMRGLDGLLSKLPDEQRACWVLRELHQLSYPEIAYAMNLPLSTIRGRIARARQNITKGMDAWR